MHLHVADRLSLRATTAAEALSPAVWYDRTNPTPAEEADVEAALGIDIATPDEMEDIELSARLYQENGAEFMTMTALANLDGEGAAKTPVTFILKGSTLATVRYADPKPFHMFLQRAARPNSQAYATGEAIIAKARRLETTPISGGRKSILERNSASQRKHLTFSGSNSSIPCAACAESAS